MKNHNIKYSILDLAIVAGTNSYQETLQNSLELAKTAEESDYTRVWYAEHHNMQHVGSTATSVLIGYIAANTNKITIGSGGIMLPNHAPLIIAEQFGTLAHLYPGRINLGLGRAPGTDQETARAIRPNFIQAAQSFPSELESIKKYFSSSNSTAKVRAPIAEGTGVPIFILGSSTDSAHLAAAKGLPYAFASHFATAQLHEALRIYKEEFRPSDDLDKPYIIAAANVFVADTQEEAEALFTSVIKMFVGIVTGSRKPLSPPSPLTDEYLEMYNHPSIHQMMRCSFYGTKEKVKTDIKDFLKSTEADEIITVTNTYHLKDRVKSVKLFSEIMKEINEEGR